ncbi:MAG: hypothetical protein V7727_14860 [Sneathiella sp.]
MIASTSYLLSLDILAVNSFDMANSKTMLAIQNNAEWCLRIWQCHGLRTFQEKNLWFCPADVPAFYPNLITMRQGVADITGEIAKARTEYASQNFSVKDSFAETDLQELNLHRLFDANWLFLSPGHNKLPASNLDWAPITSDFELGIWETHWDAREGGCKSIFLPALLADPSVKFLAGRLEGNIEAGFITNITGPVVGVSSTFGMYEDCIAHAAFQFPNYSIVSYENVETVSEATSQGFEITGDLAVWVTL